MNPSEANTYLVEYVGPVEEEVVASNNQETAPAVTVEDDMPQTVPSSPTKEPWYKRIFSGGSGLVEAGGLGAALLVLIILYLAVVPAASNGETRLELIWATLRGKTSLNTQAPGPVKEISSLLGTAESDVQKAYQGVSSGIGSNVVDFEKWIGGL